MEPKLQEALNKTYARWLKLTQCKTIEKVIEYKNVTVCALCDYTISDASKFEEEDCNQCPLNKTLVCQAHYTEICDAIHERDFERFQNAAETMLAIIRKVGGVKPE